MRRATLRGFLHRLPGRDARSAAALLCCGLLFAGINILASHVLRGARIDLTQQHLYKNQLIPLYLGKLWA